MSAKSVSHYRQQGNVTCDYLRHTLIMINVIEKTAIARPASASLPRRLAAMVYESLLLTAVLFVAAFLFVSVARTPPQGTTRLLFQLYLLGGAGAYFIWFWLHGGQTLAMKTWRIGLVAADGRRLRWPRALLRFALALASVGVLGIGLLWALVDRDKQFLHDRLARTRLIDLS